MYKAIFVGHTAHCSCQSCKLEVMQKQVWGVTQRQVFHLVLPHMAVESTIKLKKHYQRQRQSSPEDEKRRRVGLLLIERRNRVALKVWSSYLELRKSVHFTICKTKAPASVNLEEQNTKHLLFVVVWKTCFKLQAIEHAHNTNNSLFDAFYRHTATRMQDSAMRYKQSLIWPLRHSLVTFPLVACVPISMSVIEFYLLFPF